jgi:hypothetical protein
MSFQGSFWNAELPGFFICSDTQISIHYFLQSLAILNTEKYHQFRENRHIWNKRIIHKWIIYTTLLPSW